MGNIQLRASTGRELESEQLTTDPDPKLFLWVLFLLLYVPSLYYYGWCLIPNIGIDFPSYLHAARVTFLEHRTPYGLHAFDGIPGFMGGKVQPYIYPPPSLLAFWPLAKFKPSTAQNLFAIASHLCFLGSLWLIVFRLTPVSQNPRLRDLTRFVSLTYILSMFAVLDTFATGQINFVALLFICLTLVALKKDAPPWRIAFYLSIAILLKTYPVLLCLPVLFRRKYRTIGLVCAFFATYTALSYLVLPHKVWHTWWVEVVPLGGYANQNIPSAFCWNQSINAFVMRLFQENYFSKAPLFHPRLARPVATGFALLVVAVTVLYSFKASRKADRRTREDDEIAAYLLMTYLIAPLSWDHHLVYVLPAAVLGISLLVSRTVQGWWAAIVMGSVLLIAWRFPVDRLDITRGWWTLLMSAKLYPVLLLWLFFIRRLGQRQVLSPSSVGLPNERPLPVPAEAGIA